jgi:hypothetical protein
MVLLERQGDRKGKSCRDGDSGRIGGKATIMRWACWDGKEKEEVKWEQEAFAEGMRTQSAKIWAVAVGQDMGSCGWRPVTDGGGTQIGKVEYIGKIGNMVEN